MSKFFRHGTFIAASSERIHAPIFPFDFLMLRCRYPEHLRGFWNVTHLFQVHQSPPPSKKL